MKIEVGEYIRTNEGIIGIFQNIDEHCRQYGERLEDTIYIINTEKNEYLRLVNNEIVKHSKNIIDLIQCGDYVNGYEVISVDYKEDENHNYFDILGVYCIEDDYAYTIELNRIHIKTILTKEQYEKNSYKL